MRFQVVDGATRSSPSPCAPRSATGTRRSSRSSGAGRTIATTTWPRASRRPAGRELWATRRAARRCRRGSDRARTRRCAGQPPRRGDARCSALRRRESEARARRAVAGRSAAWRRPRPRPARVRGSRASPRSTAPAPFGSTSAALGQLEPVAAALVLACVECRNARRTSRASRRARSSWPSSTHEPGSSSEHRSQRCPLSSPASPTRCSPWTAMTLLAWAAAIEHRRSSGTGTPLCGRVMLRGDRCGASGLRRSRVRARDRPARLPPARPVDTSVGVGGLHRGALTSAGVERAPLR